MEPNIIVPISPESLQIAQTYLRTNSVEDTAVILGIDNIQVTQYLSRPEVKNYVDTMYLNAGYRNRNKIADALDSLIEKKLLELEESEMGSSKDIADLIMLAHKVRMDEIKAMQASHEQTVKNQTNIQINESPLGTGNYGKLLEKLLHAG